jgi:hypothetical protein
MTHYRAGRSTTAPRDGCADIWRRRRREASSPKRAPPKVQNGKTILIFGSQPIEYIQAKSDRPERCSSRGARTSSGGRIGGPVLPLLAPHSAMALLRPWEFARRPRHGSSRYATAEKWEVIGSLGSEAEFERPPVPYGTARESQRTSARETTRRSAPDSAQHRTPRSRKDIFPT